MTIIPDRQTVQPNEPFVLFLIGIRINQLWKIHKWLPVFMSMPKMLNELANAEDSGYLSGEAWFGRTTIMVQYWSSFDALETYAKDKGKAHFPAWFKFNKSVGKSGDVGIWHETYEIQPNRMECIYTNMPAFGLGRVDTLVEAEGEKRSARKRFYHK